MNESLRSPAAQPTVERLSRYRWVLEIALRDGAKQLFSHQLARLAGASHACTFQRTSPMTSYASYAAREVTR